MWNEFLKKDAAQDALFHSQRICNANMYFSYEYFIHEMAEIGNGEKPSRELPKKLDALCKALNVQDKNKFYNSDVDMIMKVRHSIAHAGCKETMDLEPIVKAKKLERLDDGTIFVSANMVNEVHADLLTGAEWIIDRAITLPNFT